MIRAEKIGRWLLLTVFLSLTTGCGSAPKSRPPRSTPVPPSTARKHSTDVYPNSVADTTRAATMRRRGKWNLSVESVQKVSEIVSESAEIFALPEDLIYGIIWVESRFDPRAVSPVGARGLMQLMPRTANYLADCIKWERRANPFDPHFNITAGTYYIARLIRDFGGDESLALAAYNAGPAKVRRWLKDGGLPKVSIEYATMVQTARTFFSAKGRETPSPRTDDIARSTDDIARSVDVSSPVITGDELDRLGLTILIAGLSNKTFGLEREDLDNPFN